MRRFLLRVLDTTLRGRRERRLSEEIQAHLDLLADEQVACGLSREEAALAARKAFGGVEQTKERYRDERGFRILDELAQDLKYAMRLMVRDRSVTVAALLALTLGIGASTFMVSVLYGLNLRPLPFEEANTIVVVGGEPNRTQGARLPQRVFEAVRGRSRSFAALAGELDAPATLGDDVNATWQCAGTFVSDNLFSILGVTPIIGRDFTPDDDRAGAPQVVIIGYRMWVDRYGSDPAVIGRAVRVNQQPAVIVGVMPDGFRYPVDTEVWRPLSAIPSPPGGVPTVRILAKLASGVTIAQARDELTTMISVIETLPEADRRRRAVVVPLNESYVGPVLQPVPMMLMAAVLTVLLVACTHAANLLLARSAARAREISLRAALGAGRARIVRQLLVESVLLALVAGAGGFLIAQLGVQRFVAEVQGFGMPYWTRFSVDARLFALIAFVCVATGILCGVVPAWHTSRANLNDVLGQSERAGTMSRRTRRLTSALVVGQLALTVVLLSTAFLLAKSANVVYRDDQAINLDSLWQFRISLPQPQYATVDARQRFYQRLDESLRSAPGMTSAAIGTPPFARADSLPVLVDTDSDPTRARSARVVPIGPRYFETLGLSLGGGTSLDNLEPAVVASSALVNERFVELFSRSQDPIGRRVRVVNERDPAATPEWFTIVGVAPPIRHGIATGVEPAVYVPHHERAPIAGTIVIRGNPSSFAEVVRQEVRRIDPELPLFGLLSLERLSEMSRWIPRITSTLLSIVAAIALMLSALGLYAITAYCAAQRTKEAGVRLALGSTPSQVSWLFLKGALVQIATGLAIGIPGAMAAGQLIQGMLIQTRAPDPIAIAGVSALLIVIAVATALLPARRAARLDPVVTLRHD